MVVVSSDSAASLKSLSEERTSLRNLLGNGGRILLAGSLWSTGLLSPVRSSRVFCPTHLASQVQAVVRKPGWIYRPCRTGLMRTAVKKQYLSLRWICACVPVDQDGNISAEASTKFLPPRKAGMKAEVTVCRKALICWSSTAKKNRCSAPPEQGGSSQSSVQAAFNRWCPFN